jgi:hypothetical protein
LWNRVRQLFTDGQIHARNVADGLACGQTQKVPTGSPLHADWGFHRRRRAQE